MKQRNRRQRRAERYLQREAMAGRTSAAFRLPHGARLHVNGTTHAAERRHWPYIGRWTQQELDEIRRDAEEMFELMRECWDEQAPWDAA